MPPPHPLSRLRPSATIATSDKIWMLRHFSLPIPNKAAARTTPETGNSGPELRESTLAVADAETVSAVVIAAPDGVTVDGEKLHDVPDGSPEHEKEVWASKRFCGVMVTVAVPLEPDAMVSAEGEMEMVKLGGRLMV